MKNLYAACLSRLGLSQAEAAALHAVRLDTVKNWCSGRTVVPIGVWNELRRREAEIVDMSETLRENWNGSPVEIDGAEPSPIGLMAVADFVLGLPEDTPVHLGRTPATLLARQARRPN